MRLAITADLHWGHRKGHDATEALAQHLHEQPPDILVIAGDIGVGPMFEDCLGLFADLNCVKAVIPGNHDLWVPHDETSYDSMDLFERLLPQAAARQGFHYLDHEPLLLPGTDLALVGSVNWYDYSWAIDALRRLFPDELDRLQSKRFTRGRHNDSHFIRWAIDDVGFTAQVRDALERHLEQAREQVGNMIVITHHPPIYDLSFPRSEPPQELDSFLWDAFCGNASVEQLLARFADSIPYIFCGHTHRARETVWEGIQGYNIGGDYHFKRLLTLDWSTKLLEIQEFGAEA